MQTTTQVIVEKIPAKNGFFILKLTLNKPHTLNALDFDIIDQLDKQLEQAKEDKNIACIIFDSSSKKAFCAGGDVKVPYNMKLEGKDPTYFFHTEYTFHEKLAFYPKPTICWGQGIIMGGGLGLHQNCTFNIVTEDTLLAMPEVKIGFFCDVGSQFFLRKIDHRIAKFLIVTGCTFTGEDAVFLRLADRFIFSQYKNRLYEQLIDIEWTKNDKTNRENIFSVLKEVAYIKKVSPTQDLTDCIHTICEVTDFYSAREIILALQKVKIHNKWFQNIQDSLCSVSLLSQVINIEYWRRFFDLSRRGIFKKDLEVAKNISQKGDFFEGVRALLIDKDKKPKWVYNSFEEIDGHIASFL